MAPVSALQGAQLTGVASRARHVHKLRKESKIIQRKFPSINEGKGDLLAQMAVSPLRYKSRCKATPAQGATIGILFMGAHA
eukprot:1161474-Pelagomonas_calceolata.AAC.9